MTFRDFTVKRSPEYNIHANGVFSHKKSLTEFDVKVVTGVNVKDKKNPEKQLNLLGRVTHNIKDQKAAVAFDLKAVYPEVVSQRFSLLLYF